jgi:hypothetical protein
LVLAFMKKLFAESRRRFASYHQLENWAKKIMPDRRRSYINQTIFPNPTTQT